VVKTYLLAAKINDMLHYVAENNCQKLLSLAYYCIPPVTVSSAVSITHKFRFPVLSVIF